MMTILLSFCDSLISSHACCNRLPGMKKCILLPSSFLPRRLIPGFGYSEIASLSLSLSLFHGFMNQILSCFSSCHCALYLLFCLLTKTAERSVKAGRAGEVTWFCIAFRIIFPCLLPGRRREKAIAGYIAWAWKGRRTCCCLFLPSFSILTVPFCCIRAFSFPLSPSIW